MLHKRFATAINCMDGRTQEPVITWIKKNYHVDFVDMITEPGPVKYLAREPQGPTSGLLFFSIDY